MGSEWDEVAGGWDEDPAARAYAQAAWDSLAAESQRRGRTLAAPRVCDFGCGTGLLTEHLAPTAGHIDALDTSPAMLAALQAKVDRNGWDHVQPLADQAALGDAYDLVVCSSVCGFVEDYPAVAADLAARLAPGGLFVQWDWEADATDPHGHGLTRDQIRDALAEAGLVEISVGIGFDLPTEHGPMRPLMGVGQRPAPDGSSPPAARF